MPLVNFECTNQARGFRNAYQIRTQPPSYLGDREDSLGYHLPFYHSCTMLGWLTGYRQLIHTATFGWIPRV